MQRRRIEAAEMKLLRPVAGYTLYDHKTNNTIRQELRVTSILDRIDECRKNWLLHLTKNATKPDPSEIIQIQTTRKKINWKTKETLARTAVTPGDGTDQRVQSLMFMMMMSKQFCIQH